jgi:hypothetical protein
MRLSSNDLWEWVILSLPIKKPKFGEICCCIHQSFKEELTPKLQNISTKWRIKGWLPLFTHINMHIRTHKHTHKWACVWLKDLGIVSWKLCFCDFFVDIFLGVLKCGRVNVDENRKISVVNLGQSRRDAIYMCWRMELSLKSQLLKC